MRKSFVLFLVYLILLVNHAKAQTFTNYTKESTSTALHAYYVCAITSDAEGNIWVGTNEGVSKFSSDYLIGIKPIISKNSLKIYPNPVQNILHIDLSGKTGVLEICDISGKSVLQKQIRDNNTSIDVSGLDDGIYIVKVLSDNQISTSKIVKY